MQALLVEDVQALAQFIRKGFQHEGYELTVAYDGLVGQSLLRQQRYDLIILDVNLPHVNGFKLCREARTLLPDVPMDRPAGAALSVELRLLTNRALTKPQKKRQPIGPALLAQLGC